MDIHIPIIFSILVSVRKGETSDPVEKLMNWGAVSKPSL
jgi:hypothetical protein